MDESPGFVRAMSAAEASGSCSAAGDPDLIREVGDWLIREGRFAADNAELFARFCERISAHSVPLDRAYRICARFIHNIAACRGSGNPGSRSLNALSTTPSRRPRLIS